MCYGRNREGSRRVSGGVGVLVNRSLESRVSSAQEELVWEELRGEGRRKLMIGVVYVNPECVRVDEMERLFEEMQVDAMKYEEKGFTMCMCMCMCVCVWVCG